MYTLSIFYGAHDSSLSIATDDTIIAHCEAERFFKEKHKTITTTPEMCVFVRECLRELKIFPHQITKLIVNPLQNPDMWGHQPPHIGVRRPYISYDHHTCHIAAALNNSHEDCLVLVADGDSELSRSTTLYHRRNGYNVQIENATATMANGSIYGTMTHLVVNPDMEYSVRTLTGKFMGLSAYGQYDDHLAELIRQNYHKLIHTYKEYDSEPLYDLFGLSRDYDNYHLDTQRQNFCHTGQVVWSEAVLEMVLQHRHLSDTICVTGGCGLNVILNTELTKHFKHVITSPVPNDSGQSLGGLLADNPKLKMKTPFLGVPREECRLLNPEIATDLADGKLVCWVRGASEIGPRALGHRSILANPTIHGIKDKINRIKGREWFRPVAPVVPLEDVSVWFETEHPSPYMSFAPQATNATKQQCPDAVHNDGTCRVQTVDKKNDPLFHQLLRQVESEYGVPMILNTSFNLAGETLVESFDDAIDAFNRSDFDILYINDKRYTK